MGRRDPPRPPYNLSTAVYNSSQYDPSAFCEPKFDSNRRQKKNKKSNKKEKKKKLYLRQNKQKVTMRKVVSSVFKNHKLFFINIVVTEICRFKIVHFLPIFRFSNRDHITGRPKLYRRIASICAQVVFKFQCFKFSHLIVINKN